MASTLAQRLQELGQEDSLFAPIDINKGYAAMKRDLQATNKRVSERRQAEEQLAQRRAAEAAALSEDELAADLAAEGSEDPSRREQDIKDMQQRVEDKLQEDADTVGPEPPSHVIAIKPTQPLQVLQLQHLPVLQPLLALPQPLSGTEAGSSEDAELRAAAAFAWLLGQCEQLLVCPDEATAKAVFRAVWCSSSRELAKAAYTKFLGWCGMSEAQSGSEVADVSEAPWFAAASSGGGDNRSLLCGAPAFADQQPHVTAQWVPGPEDFLEALAAMGCRVPGPGGAAARPAAGSRQQAHSSNAADTAGAVAVAGEQQACADANLHLLLALLGHQCRLEAQGQLPVKLSTSSVARELALLLMALLLDPRAGGSAAGRGALQDALGALMGLGDDAAWRRLEGQLLAALAPPGIGPSNRSTVLLLSRLPLTERCMCLRQQGALQLLGKLLPGRKQQQPASRSSRSARPSAHDSLLMLLGKHPNTALTKSLARASSASGSKPQQKQAAAAAAGPMDTWALLDILDAANLVLWADLVQPGAQGGGVSGEVRGWFCSWMEKLERQLGKDLKFYRLRSRLTELRNAYEFGSALVDAWGGGDSDEGNE